MSLSSKNILKLNIYNIPYVLLNVLGVLGHYI
jgi:hypothetical protein